MPLAKTYFLVPSMDYAPNDLIKLGQIISHPRTPHKALSAPQTPLPRIHEATKYNWTWERSKEISGSAGLFAKCLSIIGGVSADVSGNLSLGIGTAWRSAELYTQFIEPNDQYVNDSVHNLRDTLRGMLGKDVYMITGVKIARGTSNAVETKVAVGGEASVSFDGTAFGAPVEVGPKGSVERKVKDRQGFEGSSDFVLAYRLRKIFVRALSDKVRSRDVKGGELLSHGGGGSDDDEDSVVDSDEEEEEKPNQTLKQPVDELEGIISGEDFGMRVLPSGFTRVTVVDENGEEECQLMY